LCTWEQRAGVSKFIQSYLAWKLPLDRYGLRPDHPFVEDYASCQMAILPDGFFDMADQDLIRFRRASGWSFSENGVVLDDGTHVEADLVFLATGFEGKDKLRAVLPEPFRGLVQDKSGMMPLYRYVRVALCNQTLYCTPSAFSLTTRLFNHLYSIAAAARSTR
jgi:dimethylaniline monooxygenase (N-oxide forming)